MSLLNDVLKDLKKNKDPVTVGPLLASHSKTQLFQSFPYISPWIIVPFINAVLFLSLVYFYDFKKNDHEMAPSPQIAVVFPQRQHEALVEASQIPSIAAFQVIAQKATPLFTSALPGIAYRAPDFKTVSDSNPAAPNIETDHENQINKIFVPLTDTEWHDEQLNLALVAIQDNRDEYAEQILNRVLTRFPRAIVARETLANLYLAQERFDSARQTVEAGLAFSPNAISLNTIKARLLLEENRPREALALLKQFSPGISKYPDFYGLMAAILQSLGQQKEAGALYKVLVKIEPSNPQYWLGYGIALEQNQQTKQAISAYKAVSEHYDAEPDVRIYAENRLKTLQG